MFSEWEVKDLKSECADAIMEKATDDGDIFKSMETEKPDFIYSGRLGHKPVMMSS